MKKTYNIGSVKLNLEPNGFPKGLILNRDLTVKESRHIMYHLLGININTLDEYDDKDEYKEYNDELTNNVNSWLRGDIDDETIMEFAGDCSDEPIGIMNLIPIICYLKKKDILV